MREEIASLFPIVFILGFSLLVHLPGINSPLLDYHAYRQCQTAMMARNYARHGMHFLSPEVDMYGPAVRTGTEFPIYSFLLALLYKASGIHEFLGRLLSCLFAAWGAVYLYRFVRRRLAERVALASALVMCVIPVHLYFTRGVQPEPMALWGLLGFLFYWDRWLGSDRVADWLRALALASLGPLLKLPFIYLVVPLGGWMASERFGRSAMKKPAVVAWLAVVFGLTAGWYAYAKTAPVSILPLTLREHLQNLRSILTWALWQDHFVSRFPELCATYSGCLLIIVGAWQLWKRREAWDAHWRFWFFWFFVTAVYVILLGDYGHIHRYTELPWAPVNAVFIALGFFYLWDRCAGNRRWKAALIVLALAVPVHAALRIKHWYRLERSYLFRAHEVFQTISRPKDLVFTNTPEGPVLLYYIDRSGYSGDLGDLGWGALGIYRARGVRFFLTPIEGSWSVHPQWAREILAQASLVHRDHEYLIYQFGQSTR
jgi:hypothetical protein